MGQDGVAIGAVLAGRYRIERMLGRGGMGLVVQAMHLQLQQPVAMKFLLPEVLGNPQVVQRFLREAQAAVRLKSEHVARVLDVGSLETGAPYMVLEYLEGTDLASFPRSQLGVGEIVDLVLQACEALAEAHALGIVHRDIKPANFFLTRGADGAPLLKVLDFGISKTPATGGQLTATQAVMGTPAYMSPEQMRSPRDVDHRSDIWSLGVVLYELFQGAPPFRGDTFSSMVLKVVNDPLPRLTVRLPDGFDSVIYRCLEKDPAGRFPDVAALAGALARYAQSETQATLSVRRTRSIVGAQPSGAAIEPGTAAHAAFSTLSGASGAHMAPRFGGRRWWIAGAMVGLIGGGAGAVVALRGGSGSLVHQAVLPKPPPAVVPARFPVATSPPSAPPPALPPALPAPSGPRLVVTAPPVLATATPFAVIAGPRSAPATAAVESAPPAQVTAELVVEPRHARLAVDGNPVTVVGGRASLALSPGDHVAIATVGTRKTRKPFAVTADHPATVSLQVLVADPHVVPPKPPPSDVDVDAVQDPFRR